MCIQAASFRALFKYTVFDRIAKKRARLHIIFIQMCLTTTSDGSAYIYTAASEIIS